MARVHIESSRDAYAPLAKTWPEPDEANKKASWEQRLAPSQTDPVRVDLVAEVERSVVGFISGGEARQASIGAEVEMYVIHVLPDHRGAGVGGRLWSEACRSIRGEDLRAMYVATLAELRCCSFYELRGGVAERRVPRIFHGGSVTDVIYLWHRGRSNEALPVR
jgi:ribosomal protein S18 acetylase RimI-like enzyme